MAPLYLRITIDGVSVDILTSKRIEPHLWNSDRKIANGKSFRAQLMNRYIAWAGDWVIQIHNSLTEEDGPALAHIIKNRFINKY